MSETRAIRYLALLTVLILAELMLISLNYDAQSLVNARHSHPGFVLLARAGDAAKIMVVIAFCLILSVWPRRAEYIRRLQDVLVRPRLLRWGSAQLFFYAMFYLATDLLFGPEGRETTTLLVTSWLLSGLATAFGWLFCIAPLGFWRLFCREQALTMGLALLGGTIAWLVSQFSQDMWQPLSEWTFQLSSALLGFFYTDIVVDPALKNLGTTAFQVNIAPVCSGYEGIGLIFVFTCIYLFLFRQDFRFPQALLLFPLGITTIWLFNALRIVALIGIGSSYSPDIAIGGFHSQAGWISFIIVSTGLLVVAHKLPLFSHSVPRQDPAKAQASGDNMAMATLLPIAVLLAATLMTQALSADFNWLYPLRVVATVLALSYCWNLLGLGTYRLRLEPFLWGALVFFIWIFLIPLDAVADDRFANSLDDVSPTWAAVWLIFRAFGAVVTVPIAEELAFRGYLLARLCSDALSLKKPPRFSWFAIAISSVMFGFLHSNMLAGTIAGVIYAWVRYRGGHIGDTIAAHSVTNLLLTIYVVTTGHWSAW